MRKSSGPRESVKLDSEELVITTDLNPSSDVMTIKVYEQKIFTLNPNPLLNNNQIAKYAICPSYFQKAIAEIKDMYSGWSKINPDHPIKLIGIHNQNPKALCIQFSLGQRYFIYKRCLINHQEAIYEELFGKKDDLRYRPLSLDDKRQLISRLRFVPKAKKAISFYPLKSHYTLIRRPHSLSHPG